MRSRLQQKFLLHSRRWGVEFELGRPNSEPLKSSIDKR
jgi:hypothetical protein